MNNIARKSVCIGFATHLILTLYSQFPVDSISRTRAKDDFSLIPTWRFFAPSPARSDFVLFYRVRNSEFGDWVELTPTPKRHWYHAVWDPTHRNQKAIFDAMASMLKAFPFMDGLSIHSLGAYKEIEQYVAKSADINGLIKPGSQIQFCILGVSGYDESIQPTILFVSREFTWEKS